MYTTYTTTHARTHARTHVQYNDHGQLVFQCRNCQRWTTVQPGPKKKTEKSIIYDRAGCMRRVYLFLLFFVRRCCAPSLAVSLVGLVT
jgi:hypothetical protein